MRPMLDPAIQRWLEQHCEGSAQVRGGVVLFRGPAHDTPSTVAEWPAAGELTPQLAAAAHTAMQRARPVIVAPMAGTSDSDHNRVISLPVQAREGAQGAVALAIRADDSQTVEASFDALLRASELVGASLGAAPAPAGALADALRLQATLLRHPSLADGALAMVTELAPLLGCVRVTLGVVAGAQQGVELLAVSNSAEFQAGQELLRRVTAAMQEAVDQSAVVSCPAAAGAPMRIALAHAELHDGTGHAVVTAPLLHEGRAVGALLAERTGDTPLNDVQQTLLESVACLAAPLVDLRRRVEQPWHTRLGDVLRAGWQRLRRRDDPLPKLAVASVIAALLAATWLPVGYRVAAPARIEGEVQRAVAAPVDGFLHKTHVRPGDTVRAGDVLAELADQDLLLEEHRWTSALTQHENAAAAALARGDRVQFGISQGKAGEASAQLELVRRQLARTRLVAPIDGMVIQGDLSQALGAPVQRGDALLTLAPANRFRLMVQVDERDVAAIRPGQTGHLALAAMPTEPLGFVVERVTPVSAVVDGRNAFEVQARLQTGSAALRPGLQGIAKIDAGERSLAWIWGHRAADALRLTLWSWL